jgi:hypothetical protein
MSTSHTSQDININDLLVEALDGNHYRVACLAKAVTGSRLICTNIKSHHFWTYSDKIKLWRLVDTYYVRKVIFKTLKTLFRSRFPTSKVLEKLDNFPYQNSILREFTEQIRDEKFVHNFNMLNIVPIKQEKVIDPQNGIIRDRMITDFCTYEIPYLYEDCSEKCPIAESFLDDVVLSDVALKKYFQYVFGRLLTKRSKKSLCILYGVGNNGKSTFLNIFGNFLTYFKVPSFILTDINRAKSYLESRYDNVKKPVLVIEDTINLPFNLGCINYLSEKADILIITDGIPSCNKNMKIVTKLTLVPFNARFVKTPVKNYERKCDFNKADDVTSNKNSMDHLFSWLIGGAISSCNQECPRPQAVTNAFCSYLLQENIPIEDV